MTREGFRIELKLAQKQRSFHLMAASCAVGGRLLKPLPLPLLRWRAGVKQPMWSQHKPARMEDFKAAPHKHFTQGPSEGPPVMWLQARCTQTGPLAGQRSPYPCQFWSSANQRASPPLRFPFWGAWATSQIGWAPAALQYAHPLPTVSQQASHSHSFKAPHPNNSPAFSLPLPGGAKHMPAVS